MKEGEGMSEPSLEEKRIAADILIAAIQEKFVLPRKSLDENSVLEQIDQAYRAILQTVLHATPAEKP